MTRYIDAEKIEIRTPYGLNDDGELLIPISAVHQSIARTPTADVVEANKAMDFIASYAFKDKEEIYTNGSILVPLFRVKQALVDKAYEGLKESFNE